MTTQFASRPVASSQSGPHPRLVRVLESHLRRRSEAPLHPPSVAAFQTLEKELAEDAAPRVLDSGCGTGESTREIARAWPECVVIGIDKSAERLRRGGFASFPHREGNAIWVRAELATFWRLAAAAGWRLRRHYLLYPNPWPKPGHLQRRWHAHPVFPDLLALGGELEMRSNWQVYAEEFALAANRALGMNVRPRPVADPAVSSPFERKYRASGHRLYSVALSCDAGAV